MIPRFVPPIGFAEIAAALRPSFCDDVQHFESVFADAMGQRHAIAFPYGRTGLLALLRCLGLQGRDIICPAYTCVVVANAIIASSNRVVFVDSGADANARLDQVESAITPNTGAFIATSIFGNPVDLDGLTAMAARHPRLSVIQDCAHSFLSEWNGRPVHREGIAAIFGLNVSKTMTSIFGGMVTTDDDDVARRLREERRRMLTAATWKKTVSRLAYAMAIAPAFWPHLFAITNRMRRSGLLDRFTRYYDEHSIAMPSDYLVAMTPLEARVGAVQTGMLGKMIAARQSYDRYYREKLAGMPALSWIDRPGASSVSHVAARVAERDKVRYAAARRGVELGEVIEYSVPEMAAYRKLLPPDSRFPVASVFARTAINLPTSNRFSEARAAKVAAVVREVLRDAPHPPPLPQQD